MELDNPDETTLEILRLGQQLYQDTNGIFNFLVGGHLVARGYDADYSFAPKTEPTDFPNPLTDLIITDFEITLKNGHIDLGGYGKGYLIDLLSQYLRTLGLTYFLINGGGDMYATSDRGKPITIYLEHPTEPGIYIAETNLKDQGFAASSTHKRRWKVSGTEYSHIVDTSTGHTKGAASQNPDEFGIYVKAPSAVLADAWATTLLISRTAALPTDISEALFRISDTTLSEQNSFF
jgi:thiamine biosynthesis lipoprotein